MAQPVSSVASSTAPPYPVRFEYYHIERQAGPWSDYRTIDFFLGNNPRIKTYCGPWGGNPVGFVFQRCIVCGEEKTQEYITVCKRPKCDEVNWKMQFEWGQDARRLFDAIFFKHVDVLNEYKVDKGRNISW